MEELIVDSICSCVLGEGGTNEWRKHTTNKKKEIYGQPPHRLPYSAIYLRLRSRGRSGGGDAEEQAQEDGMIGRKDRYFQGHFCNYYSFFYFCQSSHNG